MKHCVFCAGWLPCNEVAILRAKKAVSNLELVWALNADVHGVYERRDAATPETQNEDCQNAGKGVAYKSPITSISNKSYIRAA